MSDRAVLPSPLVSIVLPTYNGARYLRQAIESCLGQTYSSLELIIVDDAATDDTPQVLATVTDPRMHVIRHAVNAGLPAALNTGFAQANGAFVTWTSDDNWYLPQAISTMLSHLMDTRSDCVYTDYFQVADEGEPCRMRLPARFTPATGATLGACFLYSRQVMAEVGAYDPDTIPAEDYDYWLRIAARFSIAHLAVPLYYYRLHPHSLTSQTAKRALPWMMNILLRLRYGHLTPAQARAKLVLTLTAQRLAASPPLAVIRRLSARWGWPVVLRCCSMPFARQFTPRIDALLSQFTAGDASCQQTLAALQALADEGMS